MTPQQEREIVQTAQEMIDRGEDGILDLLEERFPDVWPSDLFALVNSCHLDVDGKGA